MIANAACSCDFESEKYNLALVSSTMLVVFWEFSSTWLHASQSTVLVELVD
jgi:hypothetical protein